MNHLVSFLSTGFLLTTTMCYSAIGDRINFDFSTTTVSVDASTGKLSTKWVRLSRTEFEVGKAYQDDAMTTKSDEPITINIPSQKGVKRYALKLYGKLRELSNTFTIAIDGGEPLAKSTAIDPSKPHRQLLHTAVVTSSSHQVDIVNTGGEYFAIDYFSLEAIPQPIVQYTPVVSGKISSNFSGPIGNFSLENLNALHNVKPLYTIEGEDADFFQIQKNNVHFTPPSIPKTTYAASLKIDHMGDITHHPISIQIDESTIPKPSNVLTYSSTTLKTHNVYNLYGKKVLHSTSSNNRDKALPAGIYVTETK